MSQQLQKLIQSHGRVENRTQADKDKATLMQKYGGKVLEVASVPITLIDFTSNVNQIRQNTNDVSHVTKLANNIYLNGLKNNPIVEFDKSAGMFYIVSGHHRIRAIQHNNKKNKQWDGMVTVIISEFSDEKLKSFFLQKENDHLPAKRNNKHDIAIFLRQQLAIDPEHFEKFKGDKRKQEVKRMVTKHMGITHKSSIDAAYGDVFEKQIQEDTRVIHYTSLDFRNELKANHDFEGKSGQYDRDGNWVLASVPRALPAAQLTHAHRTAVPNESGKITDCTKIKIFTHFDGVNPASIIDDRERFIKTQAELNNYIFTAQHCTHVKEIVFMEQLMDGEESNVLHWEWQAADPKAIPPRMLGRFIPYVSETEEEVDNE